MTGREVGGPRDGGTKLRAVDASVYPAPKVGVPLTRVLACQGGVPGGRITGVWDVSGQQGRERAFGRRSLGRLDARDRGPVTKDLHSGLSNGPWLSLDARGDVGSIRRFLFSKERCARRHRETASQVGSRRVCPFRQIVLPRALSQGTAAPRRFSCVDFWDAVFCFYSVVPSTRRGSR